MRHNANQAVQIAIISAIAVLGAVAAVQMSQNLIAEACILGLVTLGVIGVIGIGCSSAKASQPSFEGTLAGLDGSAETLDAAKQQFAGALEVIVKLVQGHLKANSQYSDQLSNANRDLSLVVRPDQVRAVVSLLVDENNTMRSKLDDLSRGLEASRLQVAALRSDLAEANEISLRDPLTSLGNRRFFDTSLEREVAEAREECSDICLALGDIDEFKKINDSFGHQVGDKVLKMFGELLLKNIEGRDTAARYGGEEFAIIFPCTAMPDARHIVDQIRSQLAAKQWMLGNKGQRVGRITASFGVAQLRRNEDAEDLLRRADAKLYEAKLAGRNRVEIDTAA